MKSRLHCCISTKMLTFCILHTQSFDGFISVRTHASYRKLPPEVRKGCKLPDCALPFTLHFSTRQSTVRATPSGLRSKQLDLYSLGPYSRRYYVSTQTNTREAAPQEFDGQSMATIPRPHPAHGYFKRPLPMSGTVNMTLLQKDDTNGERSSCAQDS